MNIVALDARPMNPGDLSWEPFKRLGPLSVYPCTAPDEVVPRSLEADILIVNKVRLTDAVMSRLPRLKMICVSATGYNIIDVEAARRREIVVSNAPSYSTMSVAQMVFAHLLNITNAVGHYAADARRGVWTQSSDFCYQDQLLTELDGKVMGIVGFGHIGQAVARIAITFGMQVWTFTSKAQQQLLVGVEKKTLEQLTGGADVVSLHCPQTPQTTGMVNSAMLSGFRRGAILINTARGGLVDELAVAEALREGRLAAYAADVLTEEPPKADNPLLSAPNVYLTPHIAWATREARERLMHICYDNVESFLKGKPIHVVNS